MKHSSRSITVPPKITKKQRVVQYAVERGWTRIGESEWRELRQALPDVSDGVIREAGLPIDPPWRGIRQHTFEELAESLLAFSEVYQGRPDLRRECRDQVIAAKDRARFVSLRTASDAETRERKSIMVEWMLIWLGDPSIFPVWLQALNR